MKKYIIILTGLFFFAALLPASAANAGHAVVKLEGTINPVMAEFMVESIKKASTEKRDFILIHMDTPGGLMTSMQDIIKGIMGSEIPVVVFTSPRGAQAASAGGYIMLSAHVAAMAPGTRIGAMSPMNIMEMFTSKNEKGAGDDVMKRKIMNDSIAYARSIAQKRGRNVDWAERAVRDAISSTYSEALQMGVIDIVAEDTADLLRQTQRAAYRHRRAPLRFQHIILPFYRVSHDLAAASIEFLLGPPGDFLPSNNIRGGDRN